MGRWSGGGSRKWLLPQWYIYKHHHTASKLVELATDNGQVMERAPQQNADGRVKPMARKLMTERRGMGRQSHLPTWLSLAREKRSCMV
jgi:hypothetical protein